jgi:methionyl-tRNA formyltransferase
MTRAVVFAYHDVGVRCLSVLLSQGVHVSRVYTHSDDPNENIWFGSVQTLARSYGLPVTLVTRGDDPDLHASVAAEQPDFLFSFYYRFMLPPALLALAKKGAYNMHGSLLPKYRGRVPINWAIIHGERETGATLHEMVAKPDAGGIIDQQAVPILINDTALDVFRKATVAAEMVLSRALPSLLDDTAKPRPQDLSAGGYFSGRKPDDGRIDFSWSAGRIHNLIRAVAPPYPGAFCEVKGKRLDVLGTLWRATHSDTQGPPRLALHDGQMVLHCADGGLLHVSRANYDGHELTPSNFNMRLGAPSVPL